MDAYKMLTDFPQQFRRESVKRISPEDYEGVVFSGMGGSGIVGDIIKTLLENSGVRVPLLSLRGYTLPPYVKEGWLVVCTSYSGNTEETLSIFNHALSVNAHLVCISSGGLLKEYADREGVEHHRIPTGYPPRYALGYMLSVLMSLLGFDPEPVGAHLMHHRDRIIAWAKDTAKVVFSYMPIVYGTPLTEAVAFRWKTQINENTKTQCYTAVLPELHHNEVVGLDNPAVRNLCHFFLLYDEEDHPRVLKRVEITQKLLEDLGIAPVLLKGEGKNLTERLMHLIYMGDWLSYYLAEAYGYDPLPVRVIDFIKGELSKDYGQP